MTHAELTALRDAATAMLEAQQNATPGELSCFNSGNIFAADPEMTMDRHHGKHGVLIGHLTEVGDERLFAFARNTDLPARVLKLVEELERELERARDIREARGFPAESA